MHIHLLVIHPGSEPRAEVCRDGGIFSPLSSTSGSLIDRVHKASQPYFAAPCTAADAIKGDEPNNSGLRAKASFDGKVVVAQMQIMLDPKASIV